jgi:hypothetical protein
MNPSVKLSLIASGLFLLAGMLSGIWKYRKMVSTPGHQAPVYVDIAHRASLLYSFAALVIAKLLEYSPFSPALQLAITAIPLFYFAVTIIVYLIHGMRGTDDTQFSKRNFITTWGMYLLIAGEVGGFALIFGGFIYTQVLR